MALMQGAHRRHQANRAPREACGSQQRPQFVLSADELHACSYMQRLSQCEVHEKVHALGGSRPISEYRDSAAELYGLDHTGRSARRDRAGRQILSDDRVGADHAALADRDAARHRTVDAEPAVGADLDRAFAGEALPGDRRVRIVEAMLAVADKAAVGEHRVVADLDPLVGGQHRVAVEETPGADLDLSLGRQGQPAARLEQRALTDPQAALVERLEQLALNRPADQEATAYRVPG